VRGETASVIISIERPFLQRKVCSVEDEEQYGRGSHLGQSLPLEGRNLFLKGTSVKNKEEETRGEGRVRFKNNQIATCDLLDPDKAKRDCEGQDGKSNFWGGRAAGNLCEEIGVRLGLLKRSQKESTGLDQEIGGWEGKTIELPGPSSILRRATPPSPGPALLKGVTSSHNRRKRLPGEVIGGGCC